MTITNANQQRLSFVGDGINKTFPINTLSGELITGIAFFFVSEIKVYVNDVLQVLGTHYTITSTTPPINLPNRIVNANVVFVTAPPLNSRIVAVYGGTPAQTSSFQTGQGPEPETLEYVLDKIAVDLQKTNYNLSRTLRLADSNSMLESLPVLPNPEEGKILTWGENGAIVNEDLPADAARFPTPETGKFLAWNGSGDLVNEEIDTSSLEDFTSDRPKFNVFMGEGIAPDLVTTGTGHGGSLEPGRRNTIAGDGAASKMTTGHWNAIYGEQAYENGRTGKALSIFGRAAFQNNANSVDCVVIGEAAGAGIITGNGNHIVATNGCILSGIPPYMDYWYDMGRFGGWPVDPVTGFPINGDSTYPDWVSGTSYPINTIIRATPVGEAFSSIFLAPTAITAEATFNSTELAKWTRLGREHPTALWAPSTAYVIGNIVKGLNPSDSLKRTLYVAKTNHTSGATFSSAEVSSNWTLLHQLDPVETISSNTVMGNGAHFSVNGLNNTAIGSGALRGNTRYTNVVASTATTVKLAINSSPEPNWYTTNTESANPRRLCIMTGTGSTATYGVASSYPSFAPSTAYSAGTYFTAPYSEVRLGTLQFRTGTGLYKVPPGGLTSGASFTIAEAARYERIGIFSGSGSSERFIMVVDILSYNELTQTLTVPTLDTTLDTTSTYQITIYPYAFEYRTKDSTYKTVNTVSIGIDNLERAETITSGASVGRRGFFNLTKSSDCVGIGELHGELLVSGDPMTEANNIVLLGNDTRVSGSNQVQIGNSSHVVYSNTAITVRSDKRDKTDITPLDSRYTALIDHLNMYTFRWDKREFYTYRDKEKDEIVKINGGVPDGSQKGKRLHLGTIAQEIPEALEKVGLTTTEFAPYIDAKYDGNGEDVLAVQYEGLVPILWEALKEMRQENRDLKARLEAIEETLNANS